MTPCRRCANLHAFILRVAHRLADASEVLGRVAERKKRPAPEAPIHVSKILGRP